MNKSRFRLPLLLSTCLAVPVSAGLSGSEPAAVKTITLDTDFEGASVGAWEQVDDTSIEFNILADNDGTSNHKRWYSFRLTGAAERDITLRIVNAGDTNASGAWRFNAPVVSHDDGETWNRIKNARYANGVFEFAYTPETDSDWLALVPVYNFSRWLDLLEEIESHSRVSGVELLAESLDGNPVHLLSLADPDIPESEKHSIWVVGRQHPGETPGSWMIEGLIRWLLSDSPQAAALLENCSFHIIGFINPDGVLRGNFRTNAAGLNLNRQWLDTDPQAPTIQAAIDRIVHHHETHDDILLFSDKHAHSSIRENFFYYNSAEVTSREMYDEMLAFKRSFNEINPDFNPDGGRDGGIAGTTAKAWGYRALGVHSITFEAAYQDVTYGPNDGRYMTVERYLALGSDFGRAVARFFYEIPSAED